MPIFDFQCQDCGEKFDLMISNNEKDRVKCPRCSSSHIKQMLSLFNTGSSSKSSPGPVSDRCSGCCKAGPGGTCGLKY
ncbi:FmdB family zinc ribbon protein [Syntrophomonas palmitatica]|uniref:FmdB family zinc ribbon protein n=1 Tax=Syntrophomonas palmitatica TaxID=402877 RepID=UPI0006D0D1C4|nr:zinc ribbon domain-containing protein [Syntrophomonas palmitatica]